MTEILVKNSLHSQIAAKFTTTFYESTLKGNEGESVWVLIVGTTHPDLNGDPIPPVVINDLSESSIDAEIENAISSMCSLIDWAIIQEDTDGPIYISYEPTGEDVDIISDILIKVKDELPSSGLDFSNLSVNFNNGTLDFDITNDTILKQITPYEYVLRWVPDRIVRDTYHD